MKTLIARVFVVAAVLWCGSIEAEPTGCPDFEVEAPRATDGPVVRAVDFGVSEANEHNAEAANRAFAEARRVRASKVVFAPGTYRCFDGPGLKIEGLEDCVVDGGGATFVFRRTCPNQDDPSILVDGYGNVEIRDCVRCEVGNFNVDWDWEHDPLGFWCTCVDAKEGKDDNASYLDFDLEKPHPKYPNPVAIQLLTAMERDARGVKGPRMSGNHVGSAYFSTSAGSMGSKMAWLSPTRLRVWPYVRPESGYLAPYSFKRFTPQANRGTVRRFAKEEVGNLFAITHHYYGMNGVVMTSNRHFTLRNVEIWATWGLGVETRGAQKWWQLVNVNVRPKPGTDYPVTATADAHHVVQSQGFAKMVDCEVTMHRDDHFNYHDRTQIAWTKGPRTVEVVNNRGVAYTLFKEGSLLRLRQQDFSDAHWTGRIVKIDGDRVVFDRDLPEQTGLFFVLIDAEYATENFLFRNCRFHGSSFSRGLVLGNNLTFDGCSFGPMNGTALRFQSCYTYNVWCEGVGCTNVVVRNCRFEDVLDRYTVNGVNCQIFTALRLPWKKDAPMRQVPIRNPEFAKAVADYEAADAPVAPSGDAVGGVLVENCTFVNPRGYLWYVMNGSGYWFRGNTVTWTDPACAKLPYAGRVRVDAAATDVHVPAELLDRPAPPVQVDNQIPGGNIELVSVKGDEFHVRNEMRDTEGWWFWWSFRVRGAAGRKLTFHFDKVRNWNENVPNRGACVSLDKGRTWFYSEQEPFTPTSFTYTFPKDADEVWFSMSVPYGLREWEDFVRRHAGDAALKVSTLCRSRHGRDVPLARIGAAGARHRVFLSSRHHCAETTATYILEGLLEGALAQDDVGAWFRANVELVAVPMMDLDGVVEGDQGKHRRPHDYNRDYTEFIWPETRAVRDLLQDGRETAAFIDFHCPHYNDPRIHLMMRRHGRNEENQRVLAALVGKNAEGLLYFPKNNYPWGDTWNCDRLYATGSSSTLWATSLPGMRFSGCWEIPFADTRPGRGGVPGKAVTPENCRAFGRSMAKSLRAFLEDPSCGPIAPVPSPAGTVLFQKKDVPVAGAAWPVPAELASLENGFAVEFTLEAASQKPWAGVVQARFETKDGPRLPFSFSADAQNRLYFRMDTHMSVNQQCVSAPVPVFDGHPHRIRTTFEPHPDCANDTRVVGYVDGKEAFRIDRRKGRVGFSSVYENLLTVGCAKTPFVGCVRDLRVTKTR